jgi:hypothetical protein
VPSVPGRHKLQIDVVGERFDEAGKIQQSLREANRALVESLPTPSSSDDKAVVDITRRLKRKKLEREHRWDLTKQDLDRIAADLAIPGFHRGEARLRSISGSAPRREPLTYEGRNAISEIETAVYRVFGQLEGLTERALKGVRNFKTTQDRERHLVRCY